MSWEETFTSWAKGPSKTEEDKCQNAEAAIKKAITAHQKLSAMDITVFAQGSYRNKTNVRNDSDVDICVRLNSTFFADYPKDTTRDDFGNVEGSITFVDYRELIEEALVDYFDEGTVNPGNKAFNIHENTYRVDADVVAAFELRRYTGRKDSDGDFLYHSGIRFRSRDKKTITNWPDQNYANGLAKHERTGRRFRKLIRILKRLRNAMQDDGISAADDIASCLIEALVWNVPDDRFGHATYKEDVRAVLAYTFNNTINDDACNEWGEVNELQYLFRPSKPWTRQQAHKFLSAAWDYLGLT